MDASTYNAARTELVRACDEYRLAVTPEQYEQASRRLSLAEQAIASLRARACDECEARSLDPLTLSYLVVVDEEDDYREFLIEGNDAVEWRAEVSDVLRDPEARRVRVFDASGNVIHEETNTDEEPSRVVSNDPTRSDFSQSFSDTLASFHAQVAEESRPLDECSPALLVALTTEATTMLGQNVDVSLIHTGGGCMVLALDLSEDARGLGRSVWITREDEWLVGFYDFAQCDDEGVCVSLCLSSRDVESADAVAQAVVGLLVRLGVESDASTPNRRHPMTNDNNDNNEETNCV